MLNIHVYLYFVNTLYTYPLYTIQYTCNNTGDIEEDERYTLEDFNRRYRILKLECENNINS